jgi:hypothetical protein
MSCIGVHYILVNYLSHLSRHTYLKLILCIQNPHEMDAHPHTSDILPVDNILPSECGKRSLDFIKLVDDQKARVVGGYEVLKGSYPWQVTSERLSCNRTCNSSCLYNRIIS